VALSAVLGIACTAFLIERFGAFDLAASFRAVADVTGAQWGLAGLATLVSFSAIGCYDAILHRWLGTGIPPRRAGLAGLLSIAVGQVTGGGPVAGSFLRWRMLPELGLAGATRVTLAVTVLFLAALATLALAAIAILAPAALPGLAPFALLPPAAVLCLVALRRRLAPAWAARIPPPGILLRLLVAAGVDTAAAAFALWLLYPAGMAPAFATLLPVFLVALGAGLVAGTPGGIGPFDLVMIALLPPEAAAATVTALVAFRLIYYALPAILAALVLLRGPVRAGTRRETVAASAERTSGLVPPAGITADVVAAAGAGDRAEALILRQGLHGAILAAAGARERAGAGPQGLATARAGRTLTALRDPFGQSPGPGNTRIADALVAQLASAAAAQRLRPAFCKAGPRLAAAARRAGFCVLPIADEAWLRPKAFDLGLPARATLRRRLRQAKRAGVNVIRPAPDSLPFDALDAITAAWVRTRSEAGRGTERGLTMGRYDRRYVAGQAVFVAMHRGEPIAFASFHAGAREWVLDLMRQRPGAPSGTMQALIVAGIAAAAEAGAPRLSLAAHAPLGEGPAGDRAGIAARLARPAARRAQGDGLARFKSEFAPARTPLYIAAPGRLALILAACDIVRGILRPPPLPASEAGSLPLSPPATSAASAAIARAAAGADPECDTGPVPAIMRPAA
jgi:phosphatidylglycerol lysyltransferase